MKIGIFDPYLDDLGGGEKYMMMLAAFLSEKHDVSIFWDHQQDIDAMKNRFAIPFGKMRIVKNIFSPTVSFINRTKISASYDAIIVLSDGSIPILFSKKIFLHIQQPLPLSPKYTFKEKLKLKRITKVFYNSEFTKKYNQKFFPRVPSLVIYPPVHIELSHGKKENAILHVGRYRVTNNGSGDFKKQQVMIHAFISLVDKGLSNWKFILAVSVKKEDEALFASLQKEAKGYPIEFHLNRTNEELFTLYKKAKIYWHASGYGEDLETRPDLAEHFGISTVEAMGAGVVPVVINAGGQREIVTDGKNGLLWDTLDGLQEKTLQVIHNETLRESISQEAVKRANDFTEDKFRDQVLKLVSS